MRPAAIGWMAAGTAIAGVATAVTLHLTTAGSDTKVLGEKITGSGSSSPGATSSSPNKGGSNGNGNGSNGGGKTFSIAGGVDGLFPGRTVQLQLKVSNALNQGMRVNSLSASFVSITKAAHAPAGTCNPTIQIGKWTGTTFDLPAGKSNLTAPGSIAVTMPREAPDACQGATIQLSYTGSADQA